MDRTILFILVAAYTAAGCTATSKLDGGGLRTARVTNTEPTLDSPANQITGGLEPATQALIQNELQFIPPDERAAVERELQRLDDRAVRELVERRRRARLRSRNEQPDDAAPPSTWSTTAASDASLGHSTGVAVDPIDAADNDRFAAASIAIDDVGFSNPPGDELSRTAAADSFGTRDLKSVAPAHIDRNEFDAQGFANTEGSGDTENAVMHADRPQSADGGIQPAGGAFDADGIRTAAADKPADRRFGILPERGRFGTGWFDRFRRGREVDGGSESVQKDERRTADNGGIDSSNPDGADVDEFGDLLESETADPQAAARWREDLEKLVSLASAEVGQLKPGEPGSRRSREYVRNQVALRMLYLIEGRRERALEAIPDLEPREQEFWQQLLWAIAVQLNDEDAGDDRERAARTTAELRRAVETLKTDASLVVRNVNFCYRISSFGNYEKFERDEFGPGAQVLVYAEVDNFAGRRTQDNMFETVLKSRLEVYNADGQLVKTWDEEFDPTEDLCRNRRRDYFNSYKIAIPRNLSPGPHVLKLIVEDRIGRKQASYEKPFVVR